MASEPAGVEQPIRFGEGYELDLRPRRLRRGSHVLKLERIPFEILLLLLEHRDEIVPRDQIVSRVWGQGVFLDTDNSIRGAIRKLRQVLKDDAETPRFIQTVTGQGYRFIAPVITPKELIAASEPEAPVVPTSDRDFVSELDGWLQARRLRLAKQDQDPTEMATHAGTAHRQGNRKAYRWLFVGAVAVLAVACLLLFLAVRGWRRASSLPTRSQGKIVLAVLPFENLSRDPDQEFFSDGLTEEM
ncbi:MAG: winged helix-turn-helix domain-containing protein, partial [Candidatus Acidiferrales bacterium]